MYMVDVMVVEYSELCFFFKQKTAYEMLISDWSSDVCSSDLAQLYAKASGRSRLPRHFRRADDGPADGLHDRHLRPHSGPRALTEIGRASCRERVCQYV